jgi:murein L,D-transpeptidase YafK
LPPLSRFPVPATRWQEALTMTLRALILLLAAVVHTSVWADERSPKPALDKADRILVIKSSRTMMLMQGTKVLKSYKVALSTQPVGAKEREGDHKVPEGAYLIDAKNSHSVFHLALHISYPNSSDKKRALKLGVRPGGDIEIHGLGKYGWLGDMHRQVDWTDGCIAVTNSEIDEIWPLVAVGTQLEIRP